MSSRTFLWHDYETFGLSPRRDRPAQFAAIRTDMELNPIGEPINIYCQPANDYLPDPTSCLITGITPQYCQMHGLPEYQFAAEIEKAMAQPGSIVVGYNTIRFDDEVTRFLFWRNLIDPYAREWKNGCGRWDIIDLARAAYALRPEGINWPMTEEGRPSFRLEHLTAANGIAHEGAHDALSDVHATLAFARLLRNAQPRLFDYFLALHKKDGVAEHIDHLLSPDKRRPFLHVSGMFPAERGCLALMWPLTVHPTNKNEVIAWDLAHDPAELATLDAETARIRMFTKTDALPEGMCRLPVKSIHLNKSPMVASNLKLLSAASAERWQIDVAQALQHVETARALPPLDALWKQVYQPQESLPVDVDEDLYGGFVSNDDRRELERLRQLPPERLGQKRNQFADARLDELLFRYRARNFPATLSADELAEWEEYREGRLIKGEGQARTVAMVLEQCELLLAEGQGSEGGVIEALREYAAAIGFCEA